MSNSRLLTNEPSEYPVMLKEIAARPQRINARLFNPLLSFSTIREVN